MQNLILKTTNDTRMLKISGTNSGCTNIRIVHKESNIIALNTNDFHNHAVFFKIFGLKKNSVETE